MPIPAGVFTMGSPPTEMGRAKKGEIQRRVTISHSFWLGQTLVTHAQWRMVMGTDLVEQARLMLEDNTLYDLKGGKRTLRDVYHLQRHSDPNLKVYYASDDAPIYWVNWTEAVEFCRKITERERKAGLLPAGYEYRLPTEAEWEYACRAGTTTATYAGDIDIKGSNDAPVLDSIAWYAGNSSAGYGGHGEDTTNWKSKQYPGGIASPRAVATKAPNAWALYDMLGNVYEWCSDWYSDEPPVGEVRDPQGPSTGSGRVIKGGCWDFGASHCRAAARNWDFPGIRGSNIGFRIALAPVQ
jgi:sulfatase modifying factor 1